MYRLLTFTTLFTVICSATPALASDARSISLGGAVIANGKGVHGAASNPASMMAMQRRSEKTHVRLGFDVEIRDPADAIDTLSDEDNQNLIDDINRETDALSVVPQNCDPFGDADASCISNTQPLADLSDRLIAIIDQLDEEDLEGRASMGFGALVRAQLGVSLATTLTVAGRAIDVGLTPKLSSLVARNLRVNVRDEFRDDLPTASSRFEESEVQESSFTMDIGGSMALQRAPIQIAAVIRNLIPESITTLEGFEFETTPQLIVGGAFQREMFTVSGEIALNKAKQDNFESQKMGLGVEFGTQLLSLRGGIGHDSARPIDKTTVRMGFGLGPLEVGASVHGRDSLELGAQLAFSFR